MLVCMCNYVRRVCYLVDDKIVVRLFLRFFGRKRSHAVLIKVSVLVIPRYNVALSSYTSLLSIIGERFEQRATFRAGCD